MAQMWDLGYLKQQEIELVYFWGPPDNGTQSDLEEDEGAIEELQNLKELHK